ncbi:5-dehydro-2-deoxygluconokinase [Chromobacterium alkanivorans]|uniref:bifunctional 5-dehydro-2-deoxygluconokinase/5-dehydro-2- deoxyphosphogluconate aldolase n=1 Tax=Chromobacterium alkanivorans TaxID=1071719 RepID=UPI0021680486|nr:5-dehydro-2-deoxygluconokinase [Chromobacterium alkanivorans]MCS3804764.1 5-dehydro-2-deoxygluconokinase [Chromobacterium alkanivorans]MCS3819103.1 5-dehydro-2-deoxygluconokinase [Chromobacterium alkanivorans]MCS3873039.1 5-dehydro-2-deoxygluconokinase [Chromobacterium alkanivorans]
MQNTTRFASGRDRDLVCLGRLAVDLYAQQLGAPLEDAASFAKYLGGSSANIAFGAARLGLRSAMLSRVGDEQMGRFLLNTLSAEGCDVGQVKVDPERLTGLTLLGIKDRDTFPLLFYRENCADMALGVDDIDEDFIAGSKALLITGTHLSRPGVEAASRRALQYARRHDARTVLDIDYRPVLWGLAGRGDGATRYIASAEVSAHLQSLLSEFDLIVGTEEEFLIAGGAAELMPALARVRALSRAVLVVKLGPLGCAVIPGTVPARIEDAFSVAGAEVEVMNVLGAGDAFLAGFLSAWLRGGDYAECCRRANACGALVVSRHGCAPAMPTSAELERFLAAPTRRPGEDAALSRLHRVSAARQRWDELCVFAFDHRSQFFELARAAGADEARLPRLKQLLVRAVAGVEQRLGLHGRVGVLIDERYGADALYAATGRGWWVGRPVELPGSNPLVFEQGRAMAGALAAWPREHVIKCLVQYHPDDALDNRLEQEAQIRALYDAAQASGHELLLEIIPSKDLPRADDTVYRALKRLYNLGIYPDWWKLEPPAAAQWPALDALIAERDPYCRGVVLLGLNAPLDTLRRGFAAARASRSCRGFMVGRSLFQRPAERWLAGEIDDAGLVAEAGARFAELVAAWREERGAAGCALSEEGAR